jgi:hypothetical protein
LSKVIIALQENPVAERDFREKDWSPSKGEQADLVQGMEPTKKHLFFTNVFLLAPNRRQR